MIYNVVLNLTYPFTFFCQHFITIFHSIYISENQKTLEKEEIENNNI